MESLTIWVDDGEDVEIEIVDVGGRWVAVLW